MLFAFGPVVKKHVLYFTGSTRNRWRVDRDDAAKRLVSVFYRRKKRENGGWYGFLRIKDNK
jgi:hypothetical protein